MMTTTKVKSRMQNASASLGKCNSHRIGTMEVKGYSTDTENANVIDIETIGTMKNAKKPRVACLLEMQ